jgi:hypothetical protein
MALDEHLGWAAAETGLSTKEILEVLQRGYDGPFNVAATDPIVRKADRIVQSGLMERSSTRPDEVTYDNNRAGDLAYSPL